MSRTGQLTAIFDAKFGVYNCSLCDFGVYGQNGDKSKRRQVKTATPKRRQKWL